MAEEVALTTQVEGRCPLCAAPLFYVKKRATHKAYELAHIYPLNPTLAEVSELDGVSPPSTDVNHSDNIIPLCNSCHAKFDKPRTREEYEELAILKRRLIAHSDLRKIMSDFPLESEINTIITRLSERASTGTNDFELILTAKSLQDKFDPTLHPLTQHKIRRDVTDYYMHIKQCFVDLEFESPKASELIYTQVRSFYLKLLKLELSKAEIFRSVVEWLSSVSLSNIPEAAEILASFFVQNCEVFE